MRLHGVLLLLSLLSSLYHTCTSSSPPASSHPNDNTTPHMVEVEIEIDGMQGSIPVSLPYATVVDPDGQKSLSALRDKMMELGGVHPSGDEQLKQLMTQLKSKMSIDRSNHLFDPPRQTQCSPEFNDFYRSLDFNDFALVNDAQVHLCSGSHWLRFFHLFYPEANTFLDIGSNRGYWAADVFAIWRPSLDLNPRNLFMNGTSITQGGYCGWCGDCLSTDPSYYHDELPIGNFKVYGFEGSRVLVNHWKKNTMVAMNDKVKREWEMVHTAVSEQPGGTVMFPNGQDEKQSIGGEGGDKVLPPWEKSGAMIEVNNTNVDKFMKVKNLDHIDFMKIDVNGHDLSVLRGSKESIMANKVKGLLFEHCPFAEWLTNTMSDAVGMLNEWGMTCYMMGEKKLVRLTGCFLNLYNQPEDPPVTINIMCISRRVDRGESLIDLFDIHTSNHLHGYL